MTGLCLAPRHGEEEVEAETHSHLCGPCRRGLSRDLRRLPALHADLNDALVTALQKRSPGSERGLPMSEPASDCMLQIRHDLAYWCRHITGLRGLGAPPPLQDDNWAHNPVPAMAGWLHGQVTWCSFRDWAGDMAGAISEDAGRARALLDPFVKVQFEIPGSDGACLADGCDGRMVATIYASDGDRRRPQLACTMCGECLAPEQWLRYGERVIARRTAQVTPVKLRDCSNVCCGRTRQHASPTATGSVCIVERTR